MINYLSLKKNFLISHETFTKYFFLSIYTTSFIRKSRTEVIVVDIFFEDCYFFGCTIKPNNNLAIDELPCDFVLLIFTIFWVVKLTLTKFCLFLGKDIWQPRLAGSVKVSQSSCLYVVAQPKRFIYAFTCYLLNK